jgi:hypothetical protein
MAQDVKCSVDSCHFWKQGNLCTADNIMVVSYTQGEAHTSSEAGCKTFRPVEQLN